MHSALWKQRHDRALTIQPALLPTAVAFEKTSTNFSASPEKKKVPGPFYFKYLRKILISKI